jgi:hypothetical protein
VVTLRLREPERSQVLAQIRAEYEAGAKIREIADRIGFSYTATRCMLLATGAVLRSGHDHPKPRVAVVPGRVVLTVGCDRCGAAEGARCHNEYGMRVKDFHAVRKRKAAGTA